MDDWTVIKCSHCNRIFAVPYDVVSSDEDGENKRELYCPYCNDIVNSDTGFVTNAKMDKKFKKTVNYEMVENDEDKIKLYE